MDNDYNVLRHTAPPIQQLLRVRREHSISRHSQALDQRRDDAGGDTEVATGGILRGGGGGLDERGEWEEGGGVCDFADEAKNYSAAKLEAWGCVRWVGIEGESGCKRRGGLVPVSQSLLTSASATDTRTPGAGARGEVRGA